MLIDFKVQNYLSIKDEICLSMECASATSTLPNNCFTENKYKLLNSVAIYGANATGKSNFLKAIWFMKAMVENSQNNKFGDAIGVVPYKLDPKTSNKPSKFEITFILNSKKYIYGFSCTKEKIIEEYLTSTSGRGRPKELFIRKNTNKFNFTSGIPRQKRIREETNDNQLYLSKIALHNYEPLKDIYSFLTNNVAVGTNAQWGSHTRKRLNEDKDFKKWVINILKKGDFGGISDIETIMKEKEFQGFEFKFGKKPIIHKFSKEKKEFLDLKFVHLNENNKKILFEENEESTGTIKTFNMLGPIYDILRKGIIVFIDEFEINLHPEITRFLVKLFHSEHNKKQGQIIFTTHDTSLLKRNDLFRRDQIYFTEKKPNQSTSLHSLMDYDVRENIDFQNAYLNGKVGGIPFVDESYV